VVSFSVSALNSLGLKWNDVGHFRLMHNMPTQIQPVG
jgi:hypothetical protein